MVIPVFEKSKIKEILGKVKFLGAFLEILKFHTFLFDTHKKWKLSEFSWNHFNLSLNFSKLEYMTLQIYHYLTIRTTFLHQTFKFKSTYD